MDYFDRVTFEYVRNLPEGQLWKRIVQAYQSSKRGIILALAEDLCSDWQWCRDHGVPYLSLTNWDYWTVAAYVFLNLEEQKSQNKSEKAAYA